MYISQINYQKTFNIGSYQSVKIGAEMIINEGENAEDGMETLRLFVHEYFTKHTPTEECIGTQVMDIEPEVEVDRLTGLMQVIDMCTNKVALERFRTQIEKENNVSLTQLFDKKLLEVQ